MALSDHSRSNIVPDVSDNGICLAFAGDCQLASRLTMANHTGTPHDRSFFLAVIKSGGSIPGSGR
jgi:hypothetical protein